MAMGLCGCSCVGKKNKFAITQINHAPPRSPLPSPSMLRGNANHAAHCSVQQLAVLRPGSAGPLARWPPLALLGTAHWERVGNLGAQRKSYWKSSLSALLLEYDRASPTAQRRSLWASLCHLQVAGQLVSTSMTWLRLNRCVLHRLRKEKRTCSSSRFGSSWWHSRLPLEGHWVRMA